MSKAIFTPISEHYNPKAIEPMQQQKWADDKRYEVSNEKTDKPNRYILSMFPYPSGKLHMGHVRNYTIGDVLSRYYRLKGEEVMQPMGWDAFGMPAENAAIDNGVAPAKWTFANIDYMRQQLKSLGFSIDWSREFATCTPEYYHWEQWLFLKLYKKGLVYKKLAMANWDPVDNTVLANEQVIDGRGWRSGALIEKREVPMYHFKITAYAEELLNDLDKLVGHWSPQVITMQRNWIGRSEGVELHFPYTINGEEKTLDVFTTRPDTVMGITYISVAGEHELAKIASENNPALKDFIENIKKGSVAEADIAKAEKLGMDTGLTVTHPLTGEQIPVWVANYVLMSYGSGAVMAVPAHDERDFEFAHKYNLPIKQVIDVNGQTFDKDNWQDWYADKKNGVCVNSGDLDGLDFQQALNKILEKLENKGLAKKTINYRLRDWGVSRQRYWGCPVPMILCEHCGDVPVPESDLPVVLPYDVVPDGRGNPLGKMESFLNVTCPNCNRPAKRETDTFDTFMESSWYQARFASPHYQDGMIDKTASDKWLPVHQYIGGVEHAILHLLYARFYHKLMRDEGLVSGDEPFANLLTQGMVLAGTFYRPTPDGKPTYYFADDVEIEFDNKGQPISAKLKADGLPVTIGKVEKMSKSKNNGVDPQTTLNAYGADTIRLYAMFTAPADQTLEWIDDGLKGPYNFLKKVWRYAHEHGSRLNNANKSAQELQKIAIDSENLSKSAKNLRRKTHEVIAKLDDDLGKRLAFNTPVSSLMELMNELNDFNIESEQDLVVANEGFIVLLTLLAIYAPHVAEVLLESFGFNPLELTYPTVDTSALVQDSVTVVVQVNGKIRGKLEVAPNTDSEWLKTEAKKLDGVAKFLTGDIVKEIVVPNKLVNIVVKG